MASRVFSHVVTHRQRFVYFVADMTSNSSKLPLMLYRFAHRSSGLMMIALIVYWLGLFLGTHAPITPRSVPTISDKLLHFGAYAGLAVLCAANVWIFRPLNFRSLAVIFVVLACYGVVDELLQIPVGRHCDMNDWYADLKGIAVGLAVSFGLVTVLRVERFRDLGEPSIAQH